MKNEAASPGRADAELLLTAAEAEVLALEGRVRCGRMLLTRGMEAAEQYVRPGEPASDHLSRRWRRALYEYLRRHHPRVGN